MNNGSVVKTPIKRKPSSRLWNSRSVRSCESKFFREIFSPCCGRRKKGKIIVEPFRKDSESAIFSSTHKWYFTNCWAATMTQSMCCLNDCACTGMFQVDKEEQRRAAQLLQHLFEDTRERNRERPGKRVLKAWVLRNSFEYIRGPLSYPVEGHSVQSEHLLMPLQHPEIAFLPRTSAIGTVF